MKARKIILFVVEILIVVAAFCSWMFFGPTLQSPDGNFFYGHTGSGYHNGKNDLKKTNVMRNTFWFDKVAKYSCNKKPEVGIEIPAKSIIRIRLTRSWAISKLEDSGEKKSEKFNFINPVFRFITIEIKITIVNIKDKILKFLVTDH